MDKVLLFIDGSLGVRVLEEVWIFLSLWDVESTKMYNFINRQKSSAF